GEQLVLVMRLDDNTQFNDELHSQIVERNRRLPDFKRVSGCVIWTPDFPRTASLKIKRDALAEQIRATIDRSAIISI
ncbi:MAG: hypothetical protein WBE21_03325, partial [Candidatus Acidiferrales bacterium]